VKVFVYEYACALGQSTELPASVRTEGRAMLTALVEDFSRVPGVEVLTLNQQGLDTEAAAFRDLAKEADWSLIVAPEFDGILETRCRWVEEADGRLLGPSSEAVRLAADKWPAYQLLVKHSVPTPPTWLADHVEVAQWPSPCVVKPRDGAGSQGVQLIDDARHLQPRPGHLVQEYVSGVAASVAFLIGDRGVVPLLPAYQHLAPPNFHYEGGRIPLSPALAERATHLGRRAVQVIPGLRGYVGVDLVLGQSADFSCDAVIEINPRLTTSYAGLRALALDNLAAVMLRLGSGENVRSVRWRPGSVGFRADGKVSPV
jgi:hypothetical protein